MATGIDNVQQQCKVCGRHCENRRSLGNHVNRAHKELGGLKGYVLKYFLNDEVPKCKCGCGECVLWHKLVYHFNDYVNGHNPAGFKVKQPKFTTSQITHRNDRIKETYKVRQEELSDAISNAVTIAFADPVKNQRLRDGQRQGWENNEERKRELRERNVKMIDEGIIGSGAQFNTEWKSNPFTDQLEFMHCGWESQFLDEAIRVDVPFTKKHNIVITYVGIDNVEHFYIPDFVSFKHMQMCEIKGQETDIDRLKYEAGKRWCESNGFTYHVLKSPAEIRAFFQR